MSYYAKSVYTGDGTTTTYTVSFPYLDKSYVKVYLNGVLTTDYTWATDSSITFNTPPANGVRIVIKRDTDKSTKLVDFQNASIIDEATLDKNTDDLFHIAQEVVDIAEDAVHIDDADGVFDAQGKVIKNIGTPVNDNDAVNKAFADSVLTQAQASADAAATSEANAATSEANAAASEANAATSESNAATSEANALAHEQKAQKWAEEAEDVEVETGKYSAKHWAAKAQAIATGVASNISFTPYGNLSSTDVQAALQELDDEKVAKAGDTMSGNLEIRKTDPMLYLTDDATGNIYRLLHNDADNNFLLQYYDAATSTWTEILRATPSGKQTIPELEISGGGNLGKIKSFLNSNDYFSQIMTDTGGMGIATKAMLELYSNCYWTGSSYNRIDTSQPAMRVYISRLNNSIIISKASAGNNPITSWDILNGVELPLEPAYRFQLSGNVGASDLSIAASSSEFIQSIQVVIPAYKKLILKRARLQLGTSGLYLQVVPSATGSAQWQSSSYVEESSPNFTLYDNSANSTDLSTTLNVKIYASSAITVLRYAGWWLDLSIE